MIREHDTFSPLACCRQTSGIQRPPSPTPRGLGQRRPSNSSSVALNLGREEAPGEVEGAAGGPSGDGARPDLIQRRPQPHRVRLHAGRAARGSTRTSCSSGMGSAGRRTACSAGCSTGTGRTITWWHAKRMTRYHSGSCPPLAPRPRTGSTCRPQRGGRPSCVPTRPWTKTSAPAPPLTASAAAAPPSP